MSEPFLGEIKIVSWNFPPKGWTFCNGNILPINQYQALFALLGTTYGGDGMRTFALPNLQGRVPAHRGSGHVLGETAGELNHTLILAEMPIHNHLWNVSTATGNSVSPTGNLLGASPQYKAPPATQVPMGQSQIALAGGSQPHPNTQPYLVLNFIISLQGIFPTQN